MEALRLKDYTEASNKKGKAVVLEQNKCLGCGVCVYKCPSGSLTLERLSEIYHPPENVYEWMSRWIEDTKTRSQTK